MPRCLGFVSETGSGSDFAVDLIGVLGVVGECGIDEGFGDFHEFCSPGPAMVDGNVTTDDGTAWELGYAFASNSYIIGLHTDWRRRFDDEVVNLMLERSCDAMVHSLDELTTELAGWRGSCAHRTTVP